ncbi:hypothetical protein D3C86_2217570 [compost metagenome]
MIRLEREVDEGLVEPQEGFLDLILGGLARDGLPSVGSRNEHDPGLRVEAGRIQDRSVGSQRGGLDDARDLGQFP